MRSSSENLGKVVVILHQAELDGERHVDLDWGDPIGSGLQVGSPSFPPARRSAHVVRRTLTLAGTLELIVSAHWPRMVLVAPIVVRVIDPPSGSSGLADGSPASRVTQ